MMISVLAFVALSAKPTYYLAVDRLIIGSFQDRKWTALQSVKDTAKKIKFTKVGIGQTTGSWTANGLLRGGPNDAGYVDGPEVGTPDGVLFSGPVGIPSKVKVLSNSNSAYIAVVNKYLKAHKVASAARITKVVMADLDGNGTQEVVIEAANRDDLIRYDEKGNHKGDYSLVLLRYEVKGKAREYALAFDHPNSQELNYQNNLLAIADFDGNGTMDIVVSNRYYEGQSAALFGFKGSTVKKLVEMGDGV